MKENKDLLQSFQLINSRFLALIYRDDLYSIMHK